MTAFFQALYGTASVLRKEVVAAWEDERYQKIHLGSENIPFLQFPRRNFSLNMGEGTLDLSLAEVRQLLASIESACERRVVVDVKIRDTSWTTDARLKPKNPDRVQIWFRGSPGGFGATVSRQGLLSACDEFSSLFGRNDVA
ncbi:MAG: hypothetical protein V4517_26470 [Pseudomonadota bacterium]